VATEDHSRFKKLTYEGFKTLASDQTLSKYEKIGFPDAYRADFEMKIFADIRRKLSNLDSESKIILDVGPGVSDLPIAMIELCRNRKHELILIDSAEVLLQLPDSPGVKKIPARFPEECASFIEEYANRIDVILTYSVLQYVFVESSVFNFVDQLLSLLSRRGQMLIGDIPNIAKRKRFFSSPDGILHHQRFTGGNEVPPVHFNVAEPGNIDDAVVLALIARCRSSGFDAYVVPQSVDLPMANRREDILVIRP
jgi:hypothetical protein